MENYQLLTHIRAYSMSIVLTELEKVTSILGKKSCFTTFYYYNFPMRLQTLSIA